jgi:hypothetical protein
MLGQKGKMFLMFQIVTLHQNQGSNQCQPCYWKNTCGIKERVFSRDWEDTQEKDPQTQGNPWVERMAES